MNYYKFVYTHIYQQTQIYTMFKIFLYVSLETPLRQIVAITSATIEVTNK